MITVLRLQAYNFIIEIIVVRKKYTASLTGLSMIFIAFSTNILSLTGQSQRD